jgi:hypothetical protein
MKTLSLLIIPLFCTISAIAQPWIEPTAGSIYYQGNVGIGTTNPGADVGMMGGLTINGTGGTQLSVQNNGTSGFALNVGSGYWSMYDAFGGNWILGLTQKGGNVGIGTTAPSNNLNVYTTTNTGGITVTGGAGATNTSLILKNNGSGGNSWDISSTGGGHGYGDGKLLIGFGFSPMMTINGNGNVGIGTTGPNASTKLDVENSSGWGNVLIGGASGGALWLAGINQEIYSDNSYMRFMTGGVDRMTILNGGNIGIGTTTPEAKLTVKGKIVASEIQVKEIGNIPDYVFKPDYQLMPLNQVEEFVKQNQHLPEVPSEKEFKKDGMNMAEMNALLLKKVEELTLYAIEQNKQMIEQNKQIGQLKEENKIIRNLIAK